MRAPRTLHCDREPAQILTGSRLALAALVVAAAATACGTTTITKTVTESGLGPQRPAVDESHRLLTFLVSPNARATVLANGLKATAVSVAELTQILAGKNPEHRALFGDPQGFGWWVQVGSKYPNPVQALDEQYHP